MKDFNDLQLTTRTKGVLANILGRYEGHVGNYEDGHMWGGWHLDGIADYLNEIGVWNCRYVGRKTHKELKTEFARHGIILK